MEKPRPNQEFRIGHLKAAVWDVTDDDRVRSSIKFSRLYRDGEQWRSSGFFDVRDLLLLAELAQAVYRHRAPVTVSEREPE